MFKLKLLSVLLSAIFIDGIYGAFKLEERYSWNQLDFVFPSQTMKDIALASGTYIPQNALPVGVEHWSNKLFVTVPRWRDGNFVFVLFKSEKSSNFRPKQSRKSRFSIQLYQFEPELKRKSKAFN